MTTFRIVVDDKDTKGYLARIQRQLGKELGQQTFNAGQYAKNIAKSLVPIDTGITKDGILFAVKSKTRNDTKVFVGFADNPHPEKTWRGGEFNLPAWMTYSELALSHPWKNGKNPRFLLVAAEKTENKFRRDVEESTGNILAL